MHENPLTRAPLALATGPRPARRPEHIHPALVRRMAARLALEAMQIERVAQEAMREVWEEPVRSHSISSFMAPTA